MENNTQESQQPSQRFPFWINVAAARIGLTIRALILEERKPITGEVQMAIADSFDEACKSTPAFFPSDKVPGHDKRWVVIPMDLWNAISDVAADSTSMFVHQGHHLSEDGSKEVQLHIQRLIKAHQEAKGK